MKFRVARPNLIFILLVLAYPIIQELYLPFAVRYSDIPGYEVDPDSFWFWLFKNFAFFSLLITWRFTLGDKPPTLYRYGLYTLCGYGLLQMYYVLPWTSGDFMSMELPWALTLITLPIIIFGARKFRTLLGVDHIKELEKELSASRDAIDRMEWHLFQLRLANKEIQKNELNEIRTSLLKTLVMVERAQNGTTSNDTVFDGIAREGKHMNDTIREIITKHEQLS